MPVGCGEYQGFPRKTRIDVFGQFLGDDAVEFLCDDAFVERLHLKCDLVGHVNKVNLAGMDIDDFHLLVGEHVARVSSVSMRISAKCFCSLQPKESPKTFLERRGRDGTLLIKFQAAPAISFGQSVLIRTSSFRPTLLYTSIAKERFDISIKNSLSIKRLRHSSRMAHRR